jgi:hypothetical protein
MLVNRFERRQVFLSILTSSFLLTIAFIPVYGTGPEYGDFNPHVQQNTWHIYVVDEGHPGSIDVDSSCLPHISYRFIVPGTIFEGALTYASWKQGNWFPEVVDNKSGAGRDSSIVLDSIDRPTIAYWHWPYNVHPRPPDFRDLKRAYRDESNWRIEQVDNETYGYQSIGLDLDSEGLPGIGYIKDPNWPHGERDLWFAKLNSNGSWNLEAVDSNGDLRYSSTDIDSSDHYHISYEDLAGNELRYAYWNGSAWSNETVDSEGPGKWSIGPWSSIRADREGKPHIAYEDSKRGKLKYATKVLDTWQNTTVDDLRGPGLSLDLDSLGRPHISYQDVGHHLRHAWWNGTTWQIEIVDNSSEAGTFSSIRIDRMDDIHITYAGPGQVKYATSKRLPTGEIMPSIDIDPDTLNLKSKGKFITAYIELEGADVRDIDPSSILLNDEISPVLDEKYGFVTSEDSYIVDHDNDGIMERMVKFDRAEVETILAPSDEVVLTISGSLYDGAEFEGSDTIRVIHPGQ